ncbi:3-oxoacyl-[acyl-carrier-protein] synthase III C-terminal domain-containing protein [Luedemannella helvata]|uniref:3-oxoacyl-[acyl-carrier-protein] synthase III C-terminal domain-containing protein n=1 Tax=Luedemannella helvata TaxID=349315 RepID=A0ABP4VZG9_9ACTN
MTAIEAVAVHLPERRVPIESLADELGLTTMQLKLFRRYHRLAEIRQQPQGDLADLLCAAVANLKALAGREDQVRYVIHARTFPVVSPYPHNPLHQVRDRFGLDRASSFTVTHQACASGLLALDVAGRLLAADPDPDARALVLTGEKTFTHEARLVPETSVFSEGSAACLVSADGPRDRMLAYAVNLRGEFDGDHEDTAARFQREYHSSLADAIDAAVAEAGLNLDQIDVMLPHNVNAVVWSKLCRRIGYPSERVLLDNVPVTGHMFCADAFVNYTTAQAAGLLRPGGHYLIAAAGSGRGATFSAMVLTH